MEYTDEKYSKDLNLTPMNKRSLSALMGVSLHILSNMINDSIPEMGHPTKTIFSIRQIEFLINKYGIQKPKSKK